MLKTYSYSSLLAPLLHLLLQLLLLLAHHLDRRNDLFPVCCDGFIHGTVGIGLKPRAEMLVICVQHEFHNCRELVWKPLFEQKYESVHPLITFGDDLRTVTIGLPPVAVG